MYENENHVSKLQAIKESMKMNVDFLAESIYALPDYQERVMACENWIIILRELKIKFSEKEFKRLAGVSQ